MHKFVLPKFITKLFTSKYDVILKTNTTYEMFVLLQLRGTGLILPSQVPEHIAPHGAKKEEAFGGVILKSERPSGALFTNSGPPFFTVESKIEVLSPLGTSFH